MTPAFAFSALVLATTFSFFVCINATLNDKTRLMGLIAFGISALILILVCFRIVLLPGYKLL